MAETSVTVNLDYHTTIACLYVRKSELLFHSRMFFHVVVLLVGCKVTLFSYSVQLPTYGETEKGLWRNRKGLMVKRKERPEPLFSYYSTIIAEL